MSYKVLPHERLSIKVFIIMSIQAKNKNKIEY